MRYGSWIKLAGVSTLLIGCATSPPPLPRHVSRVAEAGYTGVQSTSEHQPRIIVVGAATWKKIPSEKRDKILEKNEIKILNESNYGVISDVQSDDRSTQETHAGAALGSAVAQAAYLGRSWNGGNYSPLTHLAAGLAGGIAGSAMDTGAVERHLHRYTVHLADGEIQYIDESKSSRFRHSVGVCVTVPQLDQLSQKICFESPEELASRLLAEAE